MEFTTVSLQDSPDYIKGLSQYQTSQQNYWNKQRVQSVLTVGMLASAPPALCSLKPVSVCSKVHMLACDSAVLTLYGKSFLSGT